MNRIAKLLHKSSILGWYDISDGELLMKKMIAIMFTLVIGISACAPSGTTQRRTFNGTPGTSFAASQAASPLPASATPTATASSTPLPPTETATPEPSATPSADPHPEVTLAQDTLCRSGPGKGYNVFERLTAGQTFSAYGRNEDASWLVLQKDSGVVSTCWVQASALEEFGDASSLRQVWYQPLPAAPLGFTASSNACGKDNLWLYWTPMAGVGYHLYRDGKPLATLYGSKYRDLNTPRFKKPTAVLYEIEAFNASGVSGRVSISVTLCD
jgi:hypothetical protein